MNIELKKHKKSIFFTTISLLILASVYVLTNDDILYDTNSTSPIYYNYTAINDTINDITV
jgi:hypothetical protein